MVYEELFKAGTEVAERLRKRSDSAHSAEYGARAKVELSEGSRSVIHELVLREMKGAHRWVRVCNGWDLVSCDEAKLNSLSLKRGSRKRIGIKDLEEVRVESFREGYLLVDSCGIVPRKSYQEIDAASYVRGACHVDGGECLLYFRPLADAIKCSLLAALYAERHNPAASTSHPLKEFGSDGIDATIARPRYLKS